MSSPRRRRNGIPAEKSFLQKSERYLEVFTSRDTRKNIRRIKQELEVFSAGSGKQMSGFSFSLALRQVKKKIIDEENDILEERIKQGTATKYSKVYDKRDIQIKTLNEFLVKYKQKFTYKGTPNPYLPNRKDVEGEESSSAGLNGVMIEYDSFFNGRRDPAQMKQALIESKLALNRYKRKS